MALLRAPYSYRGDPAVPAFRDDHPIIVFDGHCVLCSGWVNFVMRHDRQAKFKLLTAQSPLGHALYQHYGLDPKDYETNILIAGGLAWFKSEGTIRMCEALGLPWSLARILRLLPHSFLDKGYDYIAGNRFRFFGRRETCFVAGPEIKGRFLT